MDRGRRGKMSEGQIEQKTDLKAEQQIRNEKIKKIIQEHFDKSWKIYSSTHMIHHNKTAKLQKAFLYGFNAALSIFQDNGGLNQ